LRVLVRTREQHHPSIQAAAAREADFLGFILNIFQNLEDLCFFCFACTEYREYNNIFFQK
jgi:hypothetical protein